MFESERLAGSGKKWQYGKIDTPDVAGQGIADTGGQTREISMQGKGACAGEGESWRIHVYGGRECDGCT